MFVYCYHHYNLIFVYPSDKEVLHRMVTQHHHHNITLLLQLLSLEADVSLAVRSMFMNTLKQVSG